MNLSYINNHINFSFFVDFYIYKQNSTVIYNLFHVLRKINKFQRDDKNVTYSKYDDTKTASLQERKKRGDVDSCFDPSPILFLFVTMGAATFQMIDGNLEGLRLHLGRSLILAKNLADLLITTIVNPIFDVLKKSANGISFFFFSIFLSYFYSQFQNLFITGFSLRIL